MFNQLGKILDYVGALRALLANLFENVVDLHSMSGVRMALVKVSSVVIDVLFGLRIRL